MDLNRRELVSYANMITDVDIDRIALEVGLKALEKQQGVGYSHEIVTAKISKNLTPEERISASREETRSNIFRAIDQLFAQDESRVQQNNRPPGFDQFLQQARDLKPEEYLPAERADEDPDEDEDPYDLGWDDWREEEKKKGDEEVA